MTGPVRVAYYDIPNPGRTVLASLRDAFRFVPGSGGVAVLNPRLRSAIPPG
jgi:hypothetical protein